MLKKSRTNIDPYSLKVGQILVLDFGPGKSYILVTKVAPETFSYFQWYSGGWGDLKRIVKDQAKKGTYFGDWEVLCDVK